MGNIVGTPVVSGLQASATSFVVTLPTGIVSGEVLCVAAFIGEDQKNLSATGYTVVDHAFTSGTSSKAVLLYKEATGSEGSTITVNSTASTTATFISFRTEGYDASDFLNSSNSSGLQSANINTPSVPSGELTIIDGSGCFVMITSEASRDVTSFDADFDTEVGSDAASLSLHAYLDNTVSGTSSPQYDFTMSDTRQYGMAIFEFKQAAGSGPTATTPTSGKNGDNTQFTGTDCDTITSSVLKTTTGGASIALNTTAQTTTTINEDLESGVNDATLGVPANGVPLFAQTTAAGFTAWQLQYEVTDGTTPSAINFQLNPDDDHQTVGAMIATTNQTAGEGFGDPAISTTEDDEVWRFPKVVDGVNVTANDDLTITVDSSKRIVVSAEKWAPSTKKWSRHDMTFGTITITSVDADDTVYDGQVSVQVVGAGFGTVQGKVFIDTVEQTVTAWADALITITVVQGGLSLGAQDLRVLKPI